MQWQPVTPASPWSGPSWGASTAPVPNRLPAGLRVPLFLVGLVLAVLTLLVELGLAALAGGDAVGGRFRDEIASLVPGQTPLDPATVEEPSGLGIRYLALLDGFLLFVLLLQASSLVLSQRVAAKLQGLVTLVVSLLWVLAAVGLGLLALAQLLLMVGLFVAAPFGTIVYLAVWGFFPVGESAAVLSLVLVLKLLLAAALVVANPRVLTNTGFVALFLVSLLLQVVLSLLHGTLPGVVVSIADALVAVVISVVALLWALLSLIGAIPAVIKAIRSGVGAATPQQAAAG